MNVLLIQSDQQRFDATGLNSGGLVQTPNLDRLAARGVNFLNPYCNSPLCCPSRASAATGMWPHEVGCYGNSTPFDGRAPTYAHTLTEHGIAAASIGKLDFASGCPHGFEALDEHARRVGDPTELMRSPLTQRVGGYRRHCWDTELFDDDRDHGPVNEICQWLRDRSGDPKPWHLFANFTLPHPPFKVPRHYYDRYDPESIPAPRVPEGPIDALHPAEKNHRYHWNCERLFDEDDVRYKRRIYFAMTTWLDAMVGRVLDTLEATGQAGRTLVIFTSDHGENLGDHGMWSKGSFYDTAAKIPLIVAGPDLPSGAQVDTPVSWIDLAPTVLEAFGIEAPRHMHGHSILGLARGEAPDHPGMALGEYHGHDAATGQFMVRQGKFKYIYHVGMPAQLFDLEADPGEMHDLGESAEHTRLRSDLETLIRHSFDPEALEPQVHAYQRERLTAWIDALGPDDAHARLRDMLGPQQYEVMKEYYGF